MQNIHLTFTSIPHKTVSCIRERESERERQQECDQHVMVKVYHVWAYIQYCAKLLGTLENVYILCLTLVACTDVVGEKNTF